MLDEARGGASRGRSDRGDRASRAERDHRAARGLGAQLHALPRLEAGDAARAAPTIRCWTSTSRCSGSPRCSRSFGPDFTCVVERRAPGVRLALVCLDPARALAPIFRAGLLGGPDVGDSDAARGDSARAGPRGRPHVLGFASAAVSAREPQGVDRPGSPHDLRGAGAGTTAASPRSSPRCPTPTRATTSSSSRRTASSTEVAQRDAADARAAPRPARRPRSSSGSSSSRRSRRRRPRASSSSRSPAECTPRASTTRASSSPAVFVVSPALPQVSFERELLRRYFEEKEEAGFDYAYLQPGMTRVVQAAGRLIRSETDRGVIALLCARFLEEPYASRLPRDWYAESPSELVDAEPAEEIREFFARYAWQSRHDRCASPGSRWTPGCAIAAAAFCWSARDVRRSGGSGAFPAASASGRDDRGVVRAREPRGDGRRVESAGSAACTRIRSAIRAGTTSPCSTMPGRFGSGDAEATTPRRRAGSRRASSRSCASPSTTGRS